jgi:peptide/nickel transport system substrate-binding protein
VFHDGQAVTSADVVASIRRWIARMAAGQQVGAFVSAIEAVDAGTFRIVLKEPYGLLVESLGTPAPPFIMPEKEASRPANEQITASVGSGPFVMLRDQWRPGSKAVFVRNPSYTPRTEPADYLSGGKIVRIDRLEWIYIPDANTALNALLNAEIDYFEAPPLDFVRLLRDNPDITVLNIDRLGVQGLIRPNSSHPPFDSYKGRQAILHLVDQAEYMAAVVGDPSLSMPFCGAFFMCNSANETDAGAVRKPDIAKAKALLKEAGYKGEKLILLQPTDRPQYAAAIMVLAESLRRAGAAVELQSADWSTISVRRARKDPPDKGGWHLFVTTQGGPDPSMPHTNGWFLSKCDRASAGWACDPKLDAMVEQWARTEDAAQRRAMIDSIQTRAYESLPYIPFGQFFQPIAFRKNVTGVIEATVPVYWNLDKK